MRFLFFNIVVGLALVYLYNGGQLDLSRLESAVKASPKTVAALASTEAKPSAAHARDRMEEPATPIGANALAEKPHSKTNIQTPEPAVNTVASPKETAEKLPPIETAKTIARRIPRSPNFSAVDPREDREIAQRRAEVLGSGQDGSTRQKLTLKEGTSMMSRTERRRALDTLAEQMEMLYLENVGG